MDTVDLSKLPNGQLSWSALVRHAVATDDRVERYFLEVKSTVDLNTNAGRSKVAKFILGAANRDPARAATRFGGHAVMLLGIGSGEAPGIDSFEAMELSRYVTRVVGADGPAWDFERIPATDGRDVIAVHVAPPTGDVWTCCGNADGLRDGAVYVRADGETREATGAELRLMLNRLKSQAPDVDIEVSVEGPVHGLIVDTDFLSDAFASEAKRLRGLAVPPSSSPYGAKFAAIAGLTRDLRGRDAYFREVDEWRDRAMEDPLDGVRGLASHVRAGIQLRVTNNTSRYLRGVRIELAFDEPAEALDWNDPVDEQYAAAFPDAPKAWGTDYLGMVSPLLRLPSPSYPRSRHGIARVVTMTPAALVMEMDDLRPRQTFVSDSDDVVVAIFGESIDPGPLKGTWTMTAEDVHELFSGEFEVAVDVSDWRKSLVDWYRPDRGASPGE